MKISNEVADVLGNSVIHGKLLILPGLQLDRNLYVATNKVLMAIGGKWNRKAQAHVFRETPEAILEEILLTGEYTDIKKDYQLFFSPLKVAQQVVDFAEIDEGERVLEPSAGRGAIAKLVPGCDVIELEEKNREWLKADKFFIVGEDFLKFKVPYDVFIANPPFHNQLDITHVNHMLDLALRRVVSVMSQSVLWRTNKKTVAFRERIESLGGEFIELPEGSFAESGTNVSTCILCVDI